MNEQQILLIHLAETTLERNQARQKVMELQTRIAELEADAETAGSDTVEQAA